MQNGKSSTTKIATKEKIGAQTSSIADNSETFPTLKHKDGDQIKPENIAAMWPRNGQFPSNKDNH